MHLRDAEPGDLPAITAIYAHHVLHGTGTFEEEPPDEAEMARRIAAVQEKGWPWLVATDEDGTILGFAYLAQFRPRSAYRFAAEDSVYVRDDIRGQGVGKALVAALLAARRGVRLPAGLRGDRRLGECRFHRPPRLARLPPDRGHARGGRQVRALAGRGDDAARDRPRRPRPAELTGCARFPTGLVAA